MSSGRHLDAAKRPSSVLRPALINRVRKCSIGGKQVWRNLLIVCISTSWVLRGLGGIEHPIDVEEWCEGCEEFVAPSLFLILLGKGILLARLTEGLGETTHG